MIRAWTEAFANLLDLIPLPLLVALSVLVTAIVATLWYFWPAWLPGNRSRERVRSKAGGRRERSGPRTRFRLGALRWRWRRRRRRVSDASEAAELDPDELPDLPASVLALTADQLAAAGRYAEAVRERLRAMVAELIESGLIPASPGLTVTELAGLAGAHLPALRPALSAAVEIFSKIWYGLVPAVSGDDAAMREHAASVSQQIKQALKTRGIATGSDQ